mgnify:CR=1 FL=1|tara:strand:+ start:3639 stop:3899 length:261 start_codon:yes stop_codon:yes gene_type:complete
MKPECKIYPSGNKYWYLNGLFHREDGPAIEWVNGSKEWYLNGNLHREDGPTYEGINGHKEWYYHGKQIDCKDNQEFLRIVKLMAFL